MLPRSLLPFPLYCTIYPFHFLLSFFLCTSRVTCCLFFPNGWLLATGALDGKFFLFDAFSGKCVSKKRTSIHDGGINTIALQPFELGDTSSVNQSLPKPDQFSTGGQNYHCATAGNDYTTKIWKIRESPIDGNSKCLRYRNQLLSKLTTSLNSAQCALPCKVLLLLQNFAGCTVRKVWGIGGYT